MSIELDRNQLDLGLAAIPKIYHNVHKVEILISL